MEQIEQQSLEEAIKAEIQMLENDEQKFDKIVTLFSNQVKLLDVVINSLPKHIQQKIFAQLGLKSEQ